MTDDEFDPQFEALLRDAARTYHRPPDLPETESLWAAIDQALPAQAGTAQAGTAEAGTAQAGMERPRLTVVRSEPARRPLLANPWLRTAAVLLVGVAIGRVSTRVPVHAGAPASVASTETARPSTAADRSEADRSEADRVATTEYLGRTEALLAQLPAELEARRADPAYQTQADALLLQTRLLMDSPAATDPTLRSLFDDLELVLAQVVRLKADRDRTRVELLQQSLEQRDVLPRLRDAVADNAAD